MLGRLLKMASFSDDVGNRGMIIEDERSGLIEGERTEGLVAMKRDNKNTVDAELLLHPSPKELGAEAFAMWPSIIELAVPADWKAGDKVPAAGPHGRIHFDLPEGCQAGAALRFHLKPAADLRVQVPPGVPAGAPMTFERPDGTRICINVPLGKKPGDHFEVTPPALMVLVPEEVNAGDVVVFCMPSSSQWFKARVPENLQLGRYFAARLPPPAALQEKDGSPKASVKVGPKVSNAGGEEHVEDPEAPVE